MMNPRLARGWKYLCEVSDLHNTILQRLGSRTNDSYTRCSCDTPISRENSVRTRSTSLDEHRRRRSTQYRPGSGRNGFIAHEPRPHPESAPWPTRALAAPAPDDRERVFRDGHQNAHWFCGTRFLQYASTPFPVRLLSRLVQPVRLAELDQHALGAGGHQRGSSLD